MRVLTRAGAVEQDVGWFWQLASSHERVVLDVGTGDGAYVLDRAARDPRALIVGIDADAASMRDAARRAAAKPARGGRPNALFVQCAAEEMAEFAGAADEVVVQFPWGSLLRAVIGEAPAILGCIAATLRPGGTFRVIFSVEPRDGVSAPSDEQLQRAYATASLTICSIRPLDAAGARSIRSSWARRLGAGSRRPAVVVEARRSA